MSEQGENVNKESDARFTRLEQRMTSQNERNERHESVNRDSTDAWFARLEQRLTSQDQVLKRIEMQVTDTNGRVTALEKWRNFSVGVVTIIVLIAGWWVSFKTAGK